MNNDKNLEIKKKPQQVSVEELNKIAGGSGPGVVLQPASRFGTSGNSNDSKHGKC